MIRDSGLAHSLLTRAMSGLKNLETLSCDYDHRSQRILMEKLLDDLISGNESYDDLPALEFDWVVGARRARRRCNMDIILSAVIASGVAPSEMELTGGLFVVKKDTLVSGHPETLLYEKLFRDSFRNLKILEIVLSADTESDVKYMPWFLGTACATFQEWQLLAKRIEVLEITPMIQNTFYRIIVENLEAESCHYYIEHYDAFASEELQKMKV